MHIPRTYQKVTYSSFLIFHEVIENFIVNTAHNKSWYRPNIVFVGFNLIFHNARIAQIGVFKVNNIINILSLFQNFK